LGIKSRPKWYFRDLEEQGIVASDQATEIDLLHDRRGNPCRTGLVSGGHRLGSRRIKKTFHLKLFGNKTYLYLWKIYLRVDYPYEQMDVAGRWFDDMRLDNATKLKIGRENANELFSLNLNPLPKGPPPDSRRDQAHNRPSRLIAAAARSSSNCVRFPFPK
jgi:hypothetical protein